MGETLNELCLTKLISPVVDVFHFLSIGNVYNLCVRPLTHPLSSTEMRERATECCLNTVLKIQRRVL